MSSVAQTEGSRTRHLDPPSSATAAPIAALFENLPISLYLFGPDMRVRWLNEAAAHSLGIEEPRDAVGKDWYQLRPSLSVRRPIYDRVHAGESLSFRGVRVASPNGDRYFDVHYRPLPDGHGIMALATDVTDERLANEQLLLSNRLESLGRLSRGIAHELNNRMTALSGYLDLAQDAFLSEHSPVSDLEAARKIVDDSADLVAKLLSFASSRQMAPAAHRLSTFVEDIAKRLLGPMLGSDIRLDLDLDPSTGSAMLEPSSLEQILVNLAVNARDAMVEGGTLRLRTSPLRLTAADCSETYPDLFPGDYVVLEVLDSGPGMDEKTRQHCFEPFFSTKASRQNVGLGLSTCYGMARQMNGVIEMISGNGQGTLARLVLPRTEVQTSVPQESSDRNLDGTETVLLVDDQAAIRDVVSRYLSRYGYRVLEAENSGEALLLAEQHDGPIDLLITDIIMPRLSGPALAARVLRMRPEMRALYISGYTDHPAVVEEARSAEIPLLEKPFGSADLAHAVREVLDAPETVPAPKNPG